MWQGNSRHPATAKGGKDDAENPDELCRLLLAERAVTRDPAQRDPA